MTDAASIWHARPSREGRCRTRAPQSCGACDLPPPDLPLPERDVRRKRPPALLVPAALDDRCAGSRASLLAARARLRRDLPGDLHRAGAQGGGRATPGTRRSSCDQTKDYVSFAFLVDRAAVRRARASTPSARVRPGLSRIVASLFQVDGRGAASTRSSTARSSPATTSSTARSSSRSPTCRRCASPTSGRRARCCAPPATSAARCSSAPASTSRPSPTRCASGGAQHDQRHRLHLADAAARQRAALAGHARGPRRHRRRAHRVDEVIIADPDFPAAARRSSSSTSCHQRGVRRADRAVDDGDPRPPRRVRPRPVGAALRAQAAGLRGLRLRAQAHVRPRRSRSILLLVLSPLLLLTCARRVQAHLARPGHLPLDAARASAARRSRA